MIDKYGLYIQADGDTGDSAHRTGLASAMHELLDDEIKASEIQQAVHQYLEIGSGYYRRHPEGHVWATNPRCFSRDQASRVILAYATSNDKESIKRWLKTMLKRAMFHQNDFNDETGKWKMPDAMGIGEWCNVIRGLNLWILYPILIILDLNLISMVYIRNEHDGASLYVPDLKFALKKFWTPTAWLANRLNNKTPWLAEALNNHSLVNNGCVELQDLFKRLEKI